MNVERRGGADVAEASTTADRPSWRSAGLGDVYAGGEDVLLAETHAT